MKKRLIDRFSRGRDEFLIQKVDLEFIIDEAAKESKPLPPYSQYRKDQEETAAEIWGDE